MHLKRGQCHEYLKKNTTIIKEYFSLLKDIQETL